MRDEERRSARRVESRLRFEAALGAAGKDQPPAIFETINLSTSGLYFKSDTLLEPMTRFRLEIMFPKGSGIGVNGDGLASVKAEGTVVWAAPDVDNVGGNCYEVGVFFSRLEPGGKKRLAEHVAGVKTQS